MKGGVPLNERKVLTFKSSIADLCEKNSSFDSAVLRVCYPGLNRNGSFISKDAINRAIPTMYNCPIVCRYDRETDTIGGHDVEIVPNEDGIPSIVNLTTPVGVIPESAKYNFVEVEEEDGTTNEYLTVDALIWKRQEAYNKIKDDGVVAQSMEITVKNGSVVDDVYHIDDFEFTAFALIGVEPCFESASMEFSLSDAKAQFEAMMQDYKEQYNNISSPHGDDDTHPQNTTKGGENLEKVNELAEKYGIDLDALDFSLDEMTEEEIEAKFSEMAEQNAFELDRNLHEELCRAVCELEMVHKEWGDFPRFCMEDFDADASEVYVWDHTDWLLYGFTFSKNGDCIEIDKESKKRKKYQIVDFDEGDTQESPFAQAAALMSKAIEDAVAANAEAEDKFEQISEQFSALETEAAELRTFKQDCLNEKRAADENAVFAKFEDLVGIEAFEMLKSNCSEMAIEDIEEKCFAIRGRNTVQKFSQKQTTVRLPIEKNEHEPEVYGGVFKEFPPTI